MASRADGLTLTLADVVADGSPDAPDGMAVQANDSEEIRRSWFVVTIDCIDELKGALLVTEVGPSEWTGFRAFDPAIVDRMAAYLDETYGA